MRHRIYLSLIGTTAIGLVAPAVPATAQTNPAQTAAAPTPADSSAADPSASPSDITVTARRRNENIVDVPLAVTVVTASQIQKLGITSTNDLANFVPGLEFNDFTPGNSRNDRGGNRLLIFRGLNLSNNGGVTGAGSMFLDGAAVIGNDVPSGLDIGAVEVLRGPQSVYFGRASMTGAVSYRTKAIPEHWTEELELLGAERNTYHAEASIAGPIVPGILGIRLTGLDEANDGYITNAFGGDKLGARSRMSGSGTVEFTPTPSLEIKLYGNYFHDSDGPAATVNIFPDSANGTGAVTNCLRGVNVPTPTAANPNSFVAARATICGEVPGLSHAVAYQNTIIPPRDAAYIFNVPFLKGQGFGRQEGLQRNVLNSHAVINYTIGDYLKLQAITGYHTDAVEQVGDGVQQPVKTGSVYSNYDYNLANKFRDFSQELRLSTDPEKILSFTLGGNYVNARNLSTAIVTFTGNPTPTAANPNPVPTFTPVPQNIGDDRARTYGVFGGAYLKLLDNKLTVSAEGRYQVDNRETLTYSAAGVLLSDPASRDFKSFNPRVSLDYDLGDRRKIYASYAEGSRPGGFNSGLLVYLDPSNPAYKGAAVAADINNTFGPVSLTYNEEKLRIGEVGLKGLFGGGHGYFDLNGYFGILSNQQVRRSLLVQSLGFSLGAVQNTGKVQIYGVEFSGNYDFTRQISISTTFAWNHTKRLTYIDNSPATIALYGFSNFAGLQLPNTPLVTGSAVLSYEDSASPEFRPFGNAAVVYRGKQFADVGNFAYIPGRTTVDLRAGVANNRVRVEAFVTNVFNNLTYTGGNVAPDFGGNAVNGIPVTYSGFFGGYAQPRTVGLRLTGKFD